jgi:hypothetical protein
VSNGILQIKEYDEIQQKEIIVNNDPVTIDKEDINNLSHLFLIEHKNGGIINLTIEQLDILINLILRIKPANTVALVNAAII